jgi:hypothetical protein
MYSFYLSLSIKNASVVELESIMSVVRGLLSVVEKGINRMVLAAIFEFQRITNNGYKRYILAMALLLGLPLQWTS